MTIKNTSSKIISIGKTALLPDDTMEADEAIVNAPAIKAMIGRGQLSIKGGKAAKTAPEEDQKKAAGEAERKAKAAAEKKAKAEAAAKKVAEEAVKTTEAAGK